MKKMKGMNPMASREQAKDHLFAYNREYEKEKEKGKERKEDRGVSNGLKEEKEKEKSAKNTVWKSFKSSNSEAISLK